MLYEGQTTLTTMIFKPSRLHVQWWTDVKDVRVPALLEVGNTQLAPVKIK